MSYLWTLPSAGITTRGPNYVRSFIAITPEQIVFQFICEVIDTDHDDAGRCISIQRHSPGERAWETVWSQDFVDSVDDYCHWDPVTNEIVEDPDAPGAPETESGSEEILEARILWDQIQADPLTFLKKLSVLKKL